MPPILGRTALAGAMKGARAGQPIGGIGGASGNRSAQYEHTMIITRGTPVVVAQH
ncbi:MAG: hypothetical protein QM750_06210 [Rubrivivax sp.]